jgi:hypothetical protein
MEDVQDVIRAHAHLGLPLGRGHLRRGCLSLGEPERHVHYGPHMLSSAPQRTNVGLIKRPRLYEPMDLDIG